jgi:hypothetical protein
METANTLVIGIFVEDHAVAIDFVAEGINHECTILGVLTEHI